MIEEDERENQRKRGGGCTWASGWYAVVVSNIEMHEQPVAATPAPPRCHRSNLCASSADGPRAGRRAEKRARGQCERTPATGTPPVVME